MDVEEAAADEGAALNAVWRSVALFTMSLPVHGKA